ncbi:hypothetical protein [Winogradskyella rapida]|uniref:Lipocalin-like domain-containing protein n=1 Tax=Winogradskyella rapida TaxID=549701 RepID=A0ABW3KL80_9FLAO
MKITFKAFLILCLVGVTTACSDNDKSKVIGVWELTTRTIAIPFDVNEDGVANTNLVEEIDCNSLETLTFEENGSVYSGNEASVLMQFYKHDEDDTYGLQVDCNKESLISFASSYDEVNANTVQISGRNYEIQGDTMTVVFEDAITIYNEDFSEALETKDLTLIYTK